MHQAENNETLLLGRFTQAAAAAAWHTRIVIWRSEQKRASQIASQPARRKRRKRSIDRKNRENHNQGERKRVKRNNWTENKKKSLLKQ